MPTVRGHKQNHLIQDSNQIAGLGTKKMYVGQIENNGEKQLVFKGLETVRSDWTLLAKEFQQNLYQKVFAQQSNELLSDYILELVEQTLAGQHDDKLIYRKRLRR